MDIVCPACGETEALRGERRDDAIALTCDTCGKKWSRDLRPRCPLCGRTDLREVPLAIVEKSRGTQLSVVGTRQIHLCEHCDAETLEQWHRNRPNPLMPDELPTADGGLSAS
jgi:hypothetical protein